MPANLSILIPRVPSLETVYRASFTLLVTSVTPHTHVHIPLLISDNYLKMLFKFINRSSKANVFKFCFFLSFEGSFVPEN